MMRSIDGLGGQASDEMTMAKTTSTSRCTDGSRAVLVSSRLVSSPLVSARRSVDGVPRVLLVGGGGRRRCSVLGAASTCF